MEKYASLCFFGSGPKKKSVNRRICSSLIFPVSSDFLQANRDLFTNQTHAESHRTPLLKGDEVLFRAKFVTLGDEFKMHHLHLMELQPTGNRKKLDEIVIRENSLP